jgi:glycosyltransferase involved in cell wall biosynthesis
MKTFLDLEVVFPAYNEEKRLAANDTLDIYHKYLTAHFGSRFKIWVVVNGSSDRTYEIAQDFSRKHPGVQVLNIHPRGKGAAFKAVLPYLTAPFFAFVDLDGAILPDELPNMLATAMTHDIVIGSRKCLGARVTVKPPWHRQINSRLAQFFVKAVLGLPFKDPFCGFKMHRLKKILELTPFLKSPSAMMDLNILYCGLQKNFTIREVPIEWRHIPGSKVSVLKSDWRNLKEVFRIKYVYAKGLGLLS